VKAAASALDRVRSPARGLVILAYHRIGWHSGLELDLDAELFSRQVEELRERRVMSLDDGLDAARAEPAPEIDNPVVVTFDDGTADFADVAFPTLVAHRIPSTVYVATRFIEEGIDFRGAGRPISWGALRDCISTGLLTVGSHTHSHVLLDRLPIERVDDELDRSIGLLRDRLNIDPLHFAYPRSLEGSVSARTAVRRRFRSAAMSGTRANPYGATDRYRLMRSPIQSSDGMRWFGRKLEGGMAAEDDLRRFINRWRYARATT
jgi:peptidoglycan/xylan/chitin deacetylase (PgdA/CDA1 family)